MGAAGQRKRTRPPNALARRDVLWNLRLRPGARDGAGGTPARDGRPPGTAFSGTGGRAGYTARAANKAASRRERDGEPRARSDERSAMGECQGWRQWQAGGLPGPPEGGRGANRSFRGGTGAGLAPPGLGVVCRSQGGSRKARDRPDCKAWSASQEERSPVLGGAPPPAPLPRPAEAYSRLAMGFQVRPSLESSGPGPGFRLVIGSPRAAPAGRPAACQSPQRGAGGRTESSRRGHASQDGARIEPGRRHLGS